ncbi:MAG: molybdopterin-guanine dinucleotide biosynthesis protein B [Helicobacter sp.]|nr:molybdopterin-guanine dinucleotide biosynthesis protein B [Helicobacter sp.]
MSKIICFSGKSNSGKTTLICKLCKLCKQLGYKTAIIKHDPKDKAEFDTLGRQHNKDSFKFFQASNGVAVISPNKSTILTRNAEPETQQKEYFDGISAYEQSEFTKAIELFSDCDFVFVEGLKELPYKRIVVAREHIDTHYIPYADALAVPHGLDSKLLGCLSESLRVRVLDLDNTDGIFEFIYKEL